MGVAPVIDITDSAILSVLRAFLVANVPAGVEVIKGQVNRVPEPVAEDFVVMTPMARRRLATNIDITADVKFTGSIAGDVMTVTQVSQGTILTDAQLFGTGLTTDTFIVGPLTGTGGTGTYRITPSQIVASGTLSSGAQTFRQSTQVTVQLDVHGPSSADNAQVISTLFRDAFAVDFFAAVTSEITPLYADDPRQVPFQNAEQQWETRYVIEAMIQANPTVSRPLQYADVVDVGLIDVDVVYPPTDVP